MLCLAVNGGFPRRFITTGGLGMFADKSWGGEISLYPVLRIFRAFFLAVAGICFVACTADNGELCQGEQVEKSLKHSFSYELLSQQELPQAEFSGFRVLKESGSFVTCEARLRIEGDASGLQKALMARFGVKRFHKYEGLIFGKRTPGDFSNADRRTLNEIRYLRGIADLTAERNFGDRIFEVELPVVFLVNRSTGKTENTDFGAGVYEKVYQLLKTAEK